MAFRRAGLAPAADPYTLFADRLPLLQRAAGLPDRAVAVLCALVGHDWRNAAGLRKGCCWPSVDTLVAETGRSRSTVYRGLRELVGAGIIRRADNRGGAHRSALTHICWQVIRQLCRRAAPNRASGGTQSLRGNEQRPTAHREPWEVWQRKSDPVAREAWLAAMRGIHYAAVGSTA